MKVFGPVPSRRLGQSLGINNIPPKVCSYACVYCQLGRTIKMEAFPRAFFEPGEIWRAVQEKIKKTGHVDYLTFVADGEPTLDVNLGREIELLKSSGIKVAVITNASLLWREEVRARLFAADLVSLKVDAVREETWRRLNRPCRELSLPLILEGMLAFARTYPGELLTETMLVGNVNDSPEQIREVADFLARLNPARACLAIPIRPPALSWVRPPADGVINEAYQIFKQKISCVGYLAGAEENSFTFTGNLEEELLSIASVHPLRKEAVRELLRQAEASWAVVRKLIAQKQLLELEYEKETFYVRNFCLEALPEDRCPRLK
ncbi:MAG: radical SAM protein [Desulfotomaculales bacterium]